MKALVVPPEVEQVAAVAAQHMGAVEALYVPQVSVLLEEQAVMVQSALFGDQAVHSLQPSLRISLL